MDVPGEIPETMPLVAPTVAIGGVEDVHVPPAGEDESVMVVPRQTVPLPVTVDG